MKREKSIRLGTRASPLALIQAKKVQACFLAVAPALRIEIVAIKTSGDKAVDRPLREIGGKSLFVKELEEALLQGDIDLAVHSLKDVERPLPEELTIACVLEREDPRDAWLSLTGGKLHDMPEKARIGTCSPRRAAQILSLRPDVTLLPLRGNIDTRLAKLAAGQYDGIILAYAGLKRLGCAEKITEILEPGIMMPAVAQGVIGIEIREQEKELREILRLFNHEETEKHVFIESRFLEGFGGDCFTPVAGLAYGDSQANTLSFSARVLVPDGRDCLSKALQGDFETLSSHAYTLGQEFKTWYETNKTSPF